MGFKTQSISWWWIVVGIASPTIGSSRHCPSKDRTLETPTFTTTPIRRWLPSQEGKCLRNRAADKDHANHLLIFPTNFLIKSESTINFWSRKNLMRENSSTEAQALRSSPIQEPAYTRMDRGTRKEWQPRIYRSWKNRSTGKWGRRKVWTTSSRR